MFWRELNLEVSANLHFALYANLSKYTSDNCTLPFERFIIQGLIISCWLWCVFQHDQLAKCYYWSRLKNMSNVGWIENCKGTNTYVLYCRYGCCRANCREHTNTLLYRICVKKVQVRPINSLLQSSFIFWCKLHRNNCIETKQKSVTLLVWHAQNRRDEIRTLLFECPMLWMHANFENKLRDN